MTANERPSELKPCKKCLTPVSMLMAAASPFYTCPTEGCVNHIPVASTLDAAPADPVVSAGDDIWTCPLPTHWRAALYEARELQEWITTQQAEWIEQRAIELAREGK